MGKILELIGILAIAVGVFFFRIFVTCKIYDLTILPLGGPHLKFWQVFAVMYFIQVISTNYASEEKKTSQEHIIRLLTTVAGLLLSWGFAYWIFR
jgi:hypothetical protein